MCGYSFILSIGNRYLWVKFVQDNLVLHIIILQYTSSVLVHTNYTYLYALHCKRINGIYLWDKSLTLCKHDAVDYNDTLSKPHFYKGNVVH